MTKKPARNAQPYVRREVATEEVTQINCGMCEKPFVRKSKFIRFCKLCKNSEIWSTGNDLFPLQVTHSSGIRKWTVTK